MLERLGRVVLAHAREEGAEARIVVPSDRYVGIVGDGIVSVHALPFGIGIVQDVAIIAVHITEMDKLIVCYAVKA